MGKDIPVPVSSGGHYRRTDLTKPYAMPPTGAMQYDNIFFK